MNTYYTLAELLHNARLEKGLSIYEIEKETHIRSEYIEALEVANYAELPADVYVRGILKNYAEFLGLSYDEVVSLYRKDGVISGKNPYNKKLINSDNQLKSFNFSYFLISFLLLGVLGVITFYIWGQYILLHTPPSLIIERPQNEYEMSNIEEISLSGITELETELFINDQKVSLDENGKFSILYTLDEGDNVIKFVSKSTRNDEETVLVRTVFYEAQELNIVHTVSVETRINAVWVEIEDDNGVMFSKNIEVGETKTFNSSGKLTVRSRDAAHTYLTIDGEETGPMGDKFELKEIILK